MLQMIYLLHDYWYVLISLATVSLVAFDFIPQGIVPREINLNLGFTWLSNWMDQQGIS